MTKFLIKISLSSVCIYLCCSILIIHVTSSSLTAGQPSINKDIVIAKVSLKNQSKRSKTVKKSKHRILNNDAAIINSKAGIMLCSEHGAILYSQNANASFVPASTLKVLTSLCARHYLGYNYHFPTSFFLENLNRKKNVSSQSSNINLIIKGYGDPLFTSSVIHDACRQVSETLKSMNIKVINDIIVDNTFFSSDIKIDGNSNSNNPYDAVQGALSANFNTVSFRYSKGEHGYISDDPEIPLFPLIINRVKSSGLRSGRVVLSEEESRVYAGMLIHHFLMQEGIAIRGYVKTGIAKPFDQLIYKFTSPYDIDEIIRRLLEHSSNFMANQLFLSAGAKAFSPPATVEKGVNAMNEYAKREVGLSLTVGNYDSNNLNYGSSLLYFAEGSGLSRKNRISPADMVKILRKFKTYYHLMRSEKISETIANDRIKISYNMKNINSECIEYYKTGTLNGVRTRCGYLETSKGLYPFVIMINEDGVGYDNIRRFLWEKVAVYEGKNRINRQSADIGA